MNRESGRIYSDMLVRHYRLYRKQGVWLAPKSGERLEDALGGLTTLHAHSRDAAQQGFYKACKTAKACKQAGLDTKYPHRRKRFRTTIWKSTGITRKGERLLLARARDIEHKASRAVVQWAKERGVATLVIGDVRDVADGKRLNTKSQQKIGLWSHGRQRQYITYKAEAAGITLILCPEAYTSQTCPQCQQCYKPKGRVYRCPACGFDFPSRRGRLCEYSESALHRGTGPCAATSSKVSLPLRGQA